MRLRSHILIIAGAIIVPMVIVVALSLTWIFHRGRAEQLQHLLSNAGSLSHAVDRNFESAQATLRTLATSPHLRSREFMAFYEEAQRAVIVHEGSEAIILVAPSGRQVINTRLPYGENLPLFGDPAFIRQIVERREPAVSNLFQGRIVQRSVISIGIPVVLNGEVRYVLTLSVAPQFLQQLVARQSISLDGIAEIVDGNHIIVARSREIDKYLGKASAAMAAAERTHAGEGWRFSKSAEGDPAYAAQNRSELSDWTVVVALPKARVDAPLWQAVRNTFGAIFAVVVLGLGLAIVYGRRIVASISVLSKGAQALGAGSTMSLGSLPIDELDQVRRELENAAELRQSTDKQLRFELQLLTNITNKAAEAIFVTDADGSVTRVNPEAERILGFGANELLGETLHDKVHHHFPDGRPMARSQCALMAARAAGEAVREREEVFFHKDGTSVWVECCAAPLEIDGKNCGALLIARDITERKRSLEILELSERRLAGIMESAMDAIISINEAQEVILFNPAAERMFGYSAQEIIGGNLDRLLPQASRATHRANVQQFAATGITTRRVGALGAILGRRASGEHFPVEASISQIDLGGERLFTVILRDLSERVRSDESLKRAHEELESKVQARTQELTLANERLTELDRLKSEFLATMSHELRTPLNAIIGFSTLIRNGKVGPVSPQHKEYLGDVLSSANHLLQLINDVLDMSKIEAGRMKVDSEAFLIDDVLTDVRKSLSTLVALKGLTLVTEVAPDMPGLKTDKTKLTQILLNLANNAVKFTSRGEIRIVCSAADQQLRIDVCDTGIGIQDHQMNLLFQPFVQVDGSSHRTHEGTGLGLHLSQKLVALLYGSITVKSDYGRGSTFTVLVPLEHVERAESRPRTMEIQNEVCL